MANPYTELLRTDYGYTRAPGPAGSEVTGNTRWNREEGMFTALLLLGEAAHPGNWTRATKNNEYQAVYAHLATLVGTNNEFMASLRNRWGSGLNA